MGLNFKHSDVIDVQSYRIRWNGAD